MLNSERIINNLFVQKYWVIDCSGVICLSAWIPITRALLRLQSRDDQYYGFIHLR